MFARSAQCQLSLLIKSSAPWRALRKRGALQFLVAIGHLPAALTWKNGCTSFEDWGLGERSVSIVSIRDCCSMPGRASSATAEQTFDLVAVYNDYYLASTHSLVHAERTGQLHVGQALQQPPSPQAAKLRQFVNMLAQQLLSVISARPRRRQRFRHVGRVTAKHSQHSSNSNTQEARACRYMLMHIRCHGTANGDQPQGTLLWILELHTGHRTNRLPALVSALALLLLISVENASVERLGVCWMAAASELLRRKPETPCLMLGLVLDTDVGLLNDKALGRRAATVGLGVGPIDRLPLHDAGIGLLLGAAAGLWLHRSDCAVLVRRMALA